MVRLWLATLRVRLEVDPALAGIAEDRPWVLAFLHGKQLPLLAWRRRRETVVMVSLSEDGSLQTGALGVLGFRIVRGSSSRGGARALAALVRRVREGRDAAFAVDGPRGPYGVVKPGVLLAAARTGGVIVPMGSAVRGGKVLVRAWDRFAIAWPFGRVAVVLGPPLEVPSPAALEAAIAAANAHAEALLAAGPGRSIEDHGRISEACDPPLGSATARH